MFYETKTNQHGLKFSPFKALIVPRPIGWITTISPEGKLNLAPYSFFNGVSDQPPMVVFSSGGNKDSLLNIQATGECTCSLATMALKDEMNMSSAAVSHGVDEFALAGLETAESTMVKTPRVAASPAAFECKYWKSIDLPKQDPDNDFHFTLVLATVVGIYIDDNYIKDGLVDTGAMEPLSRLGYMDYGVLRSDAIFSLNRPEVTEGGQSAIVNTSEWDGVYR